MANKVTRDWKHVEVHLRGSVMRLTLTDEQAACLLDRLQEIMNTTTNSSDRRLSTWPPVWPPPLPPFPQPWILVAEGIAFMADSVVGFHIREYEEPLQDAFMKDMRSLVRKTDDEMKRGDDWKGEGDD